MDGFKLNYTLVNQNENLFEYCLIWIRLLGSNRESIIDDPQSSHIHPVQQSLINRQRGFGVFEFHPSPHVTNVGPRWGRFNVASLLKCWTRWESGSNRHLSDYETKLLAAI